MEGIGFGTNKMGGMEGPIGGGMKNMGRFGSGMNMGRINGGGGGSVPGIKRMGPNTDRMAEGGRGAGWGQGRHLECMGLGHMSTNSLQRMALERMGANSLERIGPAMGPALDAGIDFTGSFGGTGGHAPGVARKACQIFVTNLPFDFTWKMLKDKFNECSHVLYATIKMENGKPKGCSVVKFELPEVAERACWMMNGMKLSGRKTDVQINRNA
uniref:RRM domain-containing protein n=1 Tax=Bos indicus x Bos taurus TaxID=30522 RepID=A0A4W2CQ28_BOBOX